MEPKPQKNPDVRGGSDVIRVNKVPYFLQLALKKKGGWPSRGFQNGAFRDGEKEKGGTWEIPRKPEPRKKPAPVVGGSPR